MKVFVAGAGIMGAGIAQVFAQADWDVTLYDINLELAQKGFAEITKALEKQVQKGKITAAQKSAISGRLSPCDKLTQAAPCDLVVEAIIENVPVKKEFFKKLDNICKAETIFASNTSSGSITEISLGLTRQERFLGMHFFNPAPVMKLVEIIRGQHTSDAVFTEVFTLAKALGKEPIEVADAPGFVVNKILAPMINEAVCVLEQGVASAPDIDKAMCLGAGHPMGPLALSDLIGNDVVLNVMDTLFEETKDSKYRASLLLKKMVRAGKLGKKTGSGFYDY